VPPAHRVVFALRPDELVCSISLDLPAGLPHTRPMGLSPWTSGGLEGVGMRDIDQLAG